MSCKDDLDKFEDAWRAHLDARTPGFREPPPLGELTDGAMTVLLNSERDTSGIIEVKFGTRAAVLAALDACYQKQHRELRRRARSEAARVLQEIPEESDGTHVHDWQKTTGALTEGQYWKCECGNKYWTPDGMVPTEESLRVADFEASPDPFRPMPPKDAAE